MQILQKNMNRKKENRLFFRKKNFRAFSTILTNQPKTTDISLG